MVAASVTPQAGILERQLTSKLTGVSLPQNQLYTVIDCIHLNWLHKTAIEQTFENFCIFSMRRSRFRLTVCVYIHADVDCIYIRLNWLYKMTVELTFENFCIQSIQQSPLVYVYMDADIYCIHLNWLDGITLELSFQNFHRQFEALHIKFLKGQLSSK